MSLFNKKESGKEKFKKIDNEIQEIETSPMQDMIDNDNEEQGELNKLNEVDESKEESNKIKTQFIEVTQDQLTNLKLDRILELNSKILEILLSK